MITLSFLALIALSEVGKILIVVIISSFMPLAVITYFKVFLKKKEKEYDKTLIELGINSSKRVGDYYTPSKYILPVTFVSVICLLAITAFTFANDYAGTIEDSLLLTGTYYGSGKTELIYQSLAVLMMAFLGGFLWSAQNIIRRLIARDLSPSVFYSAGIRIILASVIALVLSFLIGEQSSTNFINFRSSLSAIAFLTGMFPERILSYLVNLYQQYFSPDKLNEDTLSLYNIEGISLQHKERLEEIGIDNAQNLATASLTGLLIETPFGARMLLDWIGQAKLLCYAKENMPLLRQAGIRTVFDLFKGNKSPEALREISESVGINTPLLQVIHNQIIEDVGIKTLYRFQHGVNVPETENNYAAEDAPLNK
ncbi:MAG: hypothetical protein ACI8YQ_003021 [Polaribacter sp.]|jgi:hypothetical protein